MLIGGDELFRAVLRLWWLVARVPPLWGNWVFSWYGWSEGLYWLYWPQSSQFFWVCLLKNPTDHDFTHDIPLPLGANPMVSPWGHPGRSPGERWQRKGPKEVPGTASFAAPKDGMQWLKVKQRRKQRILTGNNKIAKKIEWWLVMNLLEIS